MEATQTRVRDNRAVGPDTVALDLETPDGFDARPGQFVKLSLDIDGEHRSRFYTLSSSTVGETFEVTVGVDPDGGLAPHLAALEPGDSVTMAGPFGSAHYDDEPRTTILAGGPGVGPAVGIAERTLDDGGDTAVVYRDDEPVHEDRLDALAEAGATVHVVGSDADLADPTADALAGDADEQVFVYGFADFLDAATDALAAAGSDPDRAKIENFG